jgi:hypothetical protein
MIDVECSQLIVDCIGEGGARRVYTVRNNPTVVIKQVHLPCTAPNFLEWFVWNWMKDTDLHDYFGECRGISESGRYLMMERLDNIKDADYSATPTVPEWVRDVWYRSFGKNAAGAIKLRDYANVDLADVLVASRRYRRAWQH